MSTEDSKTKSGPFQGWIKSFKTDFQVTRRWFRDMLASLGAVFYKFLTKAPWRIKQVVLHFLYGILGIFTWLFVDSVKSIRRNEIDPIPEAKKADKVPIDKGVAPAGLGRWFKKGVRSLAAWTGRLFAKTVDLVSFGELIDLLTMIFKG